MWNNRGIKIIPFHIVNQIALLTYSRNTFWIRQVEVASKEKIWKSYQSKLIIRLNKLTSGPVGYIGKYHWHTPALYWASIVPLIHKGHRSTEVAGICQLCYSSSSRRGSGTCKSPTGYPSQHLHTQVPAKQSIQRRSHNLHLLSF